MKSKTMNCLMVLIACVFITAVPLAALAAESVTVEGEVNDSFQIVDSSGQIYEVADTAPGTDLVENHIGEKAKVVGTLEQDQDVKILTVTTFEIVAE